MFEAFDAPDGVLSCSRRNESTTAPQSLALLNSRFMMEQAQALAAKVAVRRTRPGGACSAAIRATQERAAAAKFLERQTAALGLEAAGDSGAGARACSISNEFLYVE